MKWRAKREVRNDDIILGFIICIIAGLIWGWLIWGSGYPLI